MAAELQTGIFEAMSQPDFYPHPVAGISSRETHISKVFLTGKIVYKIKKAVDFEFLNYRTLKKRHFYCRREVDLNRRLAPDVYLGVVPITRRRGRFSLEGSGDPVEYAVKMRQLREERTLLQLLRRCKLDRGSIDLLARRLAAFHLSTAGDRNIAKYGRIDTIRRNCEENFAQLERCGAEFLDAAQFSIVKAATRSFLVRRAALFGDRVGKGRIRDCHGDLRCGHVYFDDGLQIIDCIEFNDRFRYADTACDLAFLVMDLEYEGFTPAATDLVEAYVRHSGDGDVYILLDFYKCYRAMVKSKVSVMSTSGQDVAPASRQRLEKDARKYLALAYGYAVRFTRPTIWVIGGLPASGKSTIAAELSSVLHLEVLRSDVTRKELFGMKPQQTIDVPVGQGIYSHEASALTYGKLFLAAQEILERGQSVILDATFSRSAQRREALRLAGDTDANIIFVECTAPKVTLERRLKEREKERPVSDARLHHLEALQALVDPMDDIPGELRLIVPTDQPLRDSIQQILAHDYSLLSAVDNRRGP